MKNLFLYFLAFFSISFLISCTTTRTIPTVVGSYDGIEVYTVKNPGKEFNEIKFIQVHGGWFSGPNGLTKKLIKRAKAEGADALVNVQPLFPEQPSNLMIRSIEIGFTNSWSLLQNP